MFSTPFTNIIDAKFLELQILLLELGPFCGPDPPSLILSLLKILPEYYPLSEQLSRISIRKDSFLMCSGIKNTASILTAKVFNSWSAGQM